MKYYLLLVLFCIIHTIAIAQRAPQQFNKQVSIPLEWDYCDESANYSLNAYVQHINESKLSGPYSELKIQNTQTDQLGWKHHKFTQRHKNIEILGSSYIIHEYNHKIKKSNGFLLTELNIDPIPAITPNMAIILALEHIDAEVYKWELNEKLTLNTDLTSDIYHKPKANLCIADRHYPLNTNEPLLCYVITIYAHEPLSKTKLLLDANTGLILNEIDQLHTQNVEGIAHTKYSGIQSIITDSIGKDTFILLDRSRGNGIWTVNKNKSDSTNFFDADNEWNNVNEQFDEYATDVHFATEKTYDFFLQNFNYNSYDNSGSQILNKVHVGINFNNAFWDGRSMNFGDGDGVKYRPFTSMNLCAHEFTHGVTQNTAGLEYRYESGALNESISDIFGKTIEHFNFPNDFNWNVGDKIAIEA